MAAKDHTSLRLFVEAPLAADEVVACDDGQANYLVNVLRKTSGDSLLVFNGRDGEWRARIDEARKRSCRLRVEELTREQSAGPQVTYLFAPLKHARLDYMVQKATEMGVARLQPVITRRTIAERVNLDRMRANAIEAAEQCGILTVPEVAAPIQFGKVLDAWDPAVPLIFCDEAASSVSPVAPLSGIRRGPVAVLVGPEGGFDPDERARLLALACAIPISLGPRIMRADTAAVAALALVNTVVGGGW